MLAADVVGYSRLMEADEAATLAALKAARAGLIDPKISEHHGRIVKTAGDAPAATPWLKPPDKPFLAVLPFDNLTGDLEREHLVDGMVEEIIAALSRVKTFFVIARNSTFTYKGKAVRVDQVGRDLGVRYVVEGSVRMAGSRIRLTAQLTEAESGRHVRAL